MGQTVFPSLILLCLSLQYCQLSRDGEVYHNYCLNYSKAMNHMEQIRKKDDWLEFEKVSK